MANGVGAWTSPTDLVVDGVTFRAAVFDRFASTPELFCVVKRPDLMADYVRLVDDLQPKRIVELGICKGGSTAMLAVLAQPEKLVALELSPKRATALDRFITANDLEERVVPLYEIDQGDQGALTEIADTHFPDGDIDLVIDDASHLVEPTEASFNVLFPRLRPGGLYIIEDWAWAHLGYGNQLPDQEPLTSFVFEVLMVLPSRLGLIADITVTRDWAAVRRGPAACDAAGFDVRQMFSDRARALVTYLRSTG